MEHLTAGIREYFKDFNFKENFKGIASNVRGDVLAGITVAMVVLPMALAFGVASPGSGRLRGCGRQWRPALLRAP